MATTEIIDTLLDALGHDNLSSRLTARHQLVMQGAAAVEPLAHLLQSGTLKQQSAAIVALGEIGDCRAIQPLIEMLHHGSHRLLRMDAAKALAEFHDSQVVDALLESLNVEEELVLTWVINSLGVIHDRRALEPLIGLLHATTSPELRYMIIRALGEIGDPVAVPHILTYLNDDNHHVRRDAQTALIGLGYTSPTTGIDPL